MLLRFTCFPSTNFGKAFPNSMYVGHLEERSESKTDWFKMARILLFAKFNAVQFYNR